MKSERWQDLWRVFHQALDLEESERECFLEGIDDWEVRGELESLLAAHTEAPTLLAGPVLEDAWDEAPSLVGRQAGAYRVLREIGHGGMGTVYLAERSDQQYDREVAVKVVRRGMDTAEILARFHQERQILARLDHPNIARLFDGGTTEDGLPFFVMEHIEGEPIDRYCDRLELSLGPRLELFRAVCGAVQYAHQNLVVHRDLKPSNILVSGDGVPKLLDFGIAKLLDPASRNLTVSLAAARRLTPEFASPEQLRGDSVTTASDVYALGVLLYLLLTGRAPYRTEGRPFAAIIRAVCETEPVPPSTVVRRLENAGDPRIATLSLRSRELRGDLDNIVSKALEKDPGRRYGSVEQLAEDVRRFREGLPVAVRGGGVGYRIGKFLRRNRQLTVAAGLLLVLGLGFAVSMVVQARRTARALSLAQVESQRAEEILHVLVGQFQLADPSESLANTITAREVLERGVERIREELGTQPEMQAELLQTIGQVHHNLGLYSQAADVMTQALTIRRELAAGSPELAESLYGLATTQHELGAFERAVELHREALDLRRRRFGEDDLTVAESLGGLAAALQEQSEYQITEQHYRRALEIQRRHLGEDHEQVARSLRRLGVLLWRRGDHDAAEAMLQKALASSRASLGDVHPEMADVLHALALVQYGKGEFELAEARFLESLALQRKLFGSDHPDIASTLSNFCGMSSERGDLKAETFCRDALGMQRRLLGDEHPELTYTLNNLALLVHQKGDYEEAERLYRESLALNRKLLGEHWKVAGNLNNLALLLHDRGDFVTPEALYRESLEMYRKVLGQDHSYAGFSLNNLARLYHDRGDFEAAEPLYQEALALRRAALAEGHTQIASSASWLGKLYVDRGEPERGEPLLLEALEIRRTSLEPGDWRTAETESILGDCLAASGRFAEAEPLLTESYPVLQARRGVKDRRALQAVERAARLYERWGKPEETERFRRMASAQS